MSNSPGPMPSVVVLMPKVRDWLKEKGATAIWFPGRYCNSPRPRGKTLVDVVLFGDFFSQLLECARWPRNTYRLWVLGTASAAAIETLFGIPASKIGIIPRYELFPNRVKPRPVPRLNEEWNLVYSGRLSRSKNFHLILRVASILQSKYRSKCQLIAFGELDIAGRISDEVFPNFLTEARQLVRELSWTRKPKLLGLLPPNLWCHYPLTKPVLISLSTYAEDDFSVSVAQAQEEGWPCILTEWGGHRDAHGPNLLKVSPRMAGSITDHPVTQNACANVIAKEIIEWQRKEGSPSRARPPKARHKPAPISWENLRTKIEVAKKLNQHCELAVLSPEYLACFHGDMSES